MLIVGIAGKELTAEERGRLAAPAVSGVILFTRNFASREQVTALIDDIRALRPDPFLVCVDQEGGPVQRFREGFTRLPALARLGALYDRDPAAAIALAEEHAWVMASEMRAIDVDLSFAPVVDLARGNRAIGERAFHADPEAVSALAQAYLRGMRLAGMAATVKHFPGHGSVPEDTHFDAAVDPRTLDELRAADLVPFADCFDAGAEAVMLAHVTYPAVDAAPAGYSRVWIEDVLRGELGFRGVVFSDDIGMAAAESAGGIAARIHAHLDAGCDLVLACSPALADASLAAVRGRAPCDAERLATLRGAVASSWASLEDNPQRAGFVARLAALGSATGETHA
ncbi:beta-glucosidase-like glycosyl hydrolase [Mizugakiibacter sediminis]|uniref:Beta-hexosaminidase n=1 Tax=Mizugakiibacter sediminis TaxID=1475481 RepID=A0A0K8QJ78_9GAMM|nr:beta-N-acetylhexosaminidase [Mizugakiibacter sediminis]GAP64741.1 beta-glucosidase-like glycosyl hydrolase [Mizugakiibacter sediminis]